MTNKRMIVRVSTIIMILIVGYLGIKAVEVNQVIEGLDKQIKQAEDKLETEKMALEELQQEREKMDTLEYIEQMAREKLGMVKPDDIIFKKK